MHIKTKIDNWIFLITEQKQWMWLAAFLLAAIAYFFAFPSYNDINYISWGGIFNQANHPFVNNEGQPGSHTAKLIFRLVVPLMIRFFHFNIPGLLIFMGITGVCNFYLIIRIADKILHDKRQAFLVGLCTALIYTGKCPYIQFGGGLYEWIALFFVLCALNTKNNLLVFLFIFLSSWSDERALASSALIWMYYIIKNDQQKMVLRFFTVKSMSIYAAWVGYFAVRYYLSVQYGLRTDTKGIGMGVFFNQINNFPLGIWSALEGLWLIILYSFALLYNNKKFFELLKYAGISCLILAMGLAVIDITRSMVYLYPAVFIALLIIHKYSDKETLNKLLWFAVILCFVYPAYYTGGKSSVWWSYPLPIQLIRMML